MVDANGNVKRLAAEPRPAAFAGCDSAQRVTRYDTSEPPRHARRAHETLHTAAYHRCRTFDTTPRAPCRPSDMIRPARRAFGPRALTVRRHARSWRNDEWRYLIVALRHSVAPRTLVSQQPPLRLGPGRANPGTPRNGAPTECPPRRGRSSCSRPAHGPRAAAGASEQHTSGARSIERGRAPRPERATTKPRRRGPSGRRPSHDGVARGQRPGPEKATPSNHGRVTHEVCRPAKGQWLLGRTHGSFSKLAEIVAPPSTRTNRPGKNTTAFVRKALRRYRIAFERYRPQESWRALHLGPIARLLGPPRGIRS